MGLLGYLFPRILVGAGVPVDAWAISFGQHLRPGMPAKSPEAALTAVGLASAILLMSAELWFKPVGKLLAKIRNAAPAQAERTQPIQRSANVPEPSRFPLQQIADRWTERYGAKYTPKTIYQMYQDGYFELDWEDETIFPDNLSMLERMSATAEGRFEVHREYFMPKSERDRFEFENPPDGLTRIPLAEAMILAYTQTKDTQSGRLAIGNEEGIEVHYVLMLLHTTNIPVYGRTPTTSTKICIPDSHLTRLGFIHAKDINNPQPFNAIRYCDLEIERRHLAPFVEILKGNQEGEFFGNR